MKAKDIIALAQAEVGYLGKKSNAELYNKISNTSGKYNKYAQELYDSGQYYNANKNGFSYCAIFVDWLFYHQAGNNAEEAKKVKPYNLYNPSVYWSYKAYFDVERTGSLPKVGASIFFKTKDGKEMWAHTGIVSKVNADTIETIEGNVSNNVVSKTYSINDPIIICYGYPFYEEEPEPQPEDWETIAEWQDIDGKNLRLQKHK